jgi:hypothetical protein
MHVRIHVKYPLFLSNFNKTRISSTGFRKILKYDFHENQSGGSRVVPCGRTEMTKLVATYRNFADLKTLKPKARELVHANLSYFKGHANTESLYELIC